MREGLLPEHRSQWPADPDEAGLEELDDDLEQALLQVRTLIENTVLKHRDRVSRRGQVLEVNPEEPVVGATAAEMIAQATSSVEVVLASSGEPARSAQTALTDLLTDSSRRVHCRVLSTQAVLEATRRQQPLCTATDQLEVRIARIPMLAAVIVDGTTALACAESAQGRRASVIRAPAVVRTLLTLFDGVWRNAVVAAERIDFADRARSETTRQILAKLQAGVTDETAARDLCVSVRTYRRHVAEIMALLGATSRFQAGVRAAELGLLPGPPPQPGAPPQPGPARQPGSPQQPGGR